MFFFSEIVLYLCSVQNIRLQNTEFMINTVETVEQKKATLAARLEAIKGNWPYSERAAWCISNGYNTDHITKSYLRGSVASIPVAEKIVETIEKYMKANGIVA